MRQVGASGNGSLSILLQRYLEGVSELWYFQQRISLVVEVVPYKPTLEVLAFHIASTKFLVSFRFEPHCFATFGTPPSPLRRSSSMLPINPGLPTDCLVSRLQLVQGIFKSLSVRVPFVAYTVGWRKIIVTPPLAL
jgi:hypothetical protein